MFHVKHHTHITTYTHITRRDAHHQRTSTPSYQRHDRRQVHTPPAHQQDYQPTGLWTTTSINQHHQQNDPYNPLPPTICQDFSLTHITS